MVYIVEHQKEHPKSVYSITFLLAISVCDLGNLARFGGLIILLVWIPNFGRLLRIASKGVLSSSVSSLYT